MSTDSGSGSRWEPSPPPATGEDGPAVEQVEHPAQASAAGWRDGRTRGPGWLAAGAAAVVFVVGGAGGFLVGHATAGGAEGADRFGQQGQPGGFGPGRNGGPPAQMPGMPPRQDDRRGQDSGTRGSGT
jgi:hypothetical protein